MFLQVLVIVTAAICWCSVIVHCEAATSFVVAHIEDGEETALLVAKDFGFHFGSSVFDEETLYYFIYRDVMNTSYSKVIHGLSRDSRVSWVQTQRKRFRPLRRHVGYEHKIPNYIRPFHMDSLIRGSPKSRGQFAAAPFNDPLYPDQWYLHNEGQNGGLPSKNDLNVLPVWASGITGRGVTVSVLDDGIDHEHPDVVANYDPSVSYDFVDLDDAIHDPMPDVSEMPNSHGTYCATIIAAVANNGVCGVGIAFEAKIGGSRLVDGFVSDLQEALAVSYGLDQIDIFSASWGPTDDGARVAGPGLLTSRAFHKGITKGRRGKGVIYVWAAGNGGAKLDNCNMDGYVSSIYTLAIGAVTYDGLSSYYSEPCAGILASTYVGGVHGPASTQALRQDAHKIKVVVAEVGGGCRESFQGTSAAAPMAAGILALVLQANPALTWRDVQHLVVESARIPNPTEPGWQINGAGHHFHLRYGFGVLDAVRLVSMAKEWSLVRPQKNATVYCTRLPRLIYENRTTYVSVDVPGPGIEDPFLISVEHVIATVDILHRCRGGMELFLVSPSGTVSQVLTRRPHDKSRRGLQAWGLMSVHFWGEDPFGKWVLAVSDRGRPATKGRMLKVGKVNKFSLTLFGTEFSDAPRANGREQRWWRPNVEQNSDFPRQPSVAFMEKMMKRELDETEAMKSRILNSFDKFQQ